MSSPGSTLRSVALVTGATAGIGAEFTRQLAARGHDLVLVARDRERLEAAAVSVRQEFGVEVEVIAADLQSPEGLARVEHRVGSAERVVEVLVNNAGYGLRGQFDENPVELELDHLALLVTVPLRLSHAALTQMLPRASGTIVNVASIAGFTPRGTYGAAKAWGLSFSRWANIAYRRRGVRVMALAPGFVRTEFHARMSVRTDGIPRFLWLDAPRVVREGLRDVDRGKAVSIPSIRYKLVASLCRVLPARLMAAGTLRWR